MIITPYPVLTLPNTTANFPCLKHCFTTAGVNTTAKTWSDEVGNLVLTAATSITIDAMKGAAISGAQTITGTPITAGAKSVLLYVNGYVFSAASTWRLGDSDGLTTGPGIGLSGNAQNYVLRTPTLYLLSSAITITSNYPFQGSLALIADNAGNEARKYAVDGAGALTTSLKAAGGAEANITGSWTQFPLATATSNMFPTSTSYTKALFVFVFDSGYPADMVNAMHWMNANPGKIYPGWRGLA